MKHLIFILTFLLVVVNLFLFAGSLKIGDQILKTENNIKILKTQNAQLSKKLYSASSLQNLTRQAEDLGFSEKAQPMYLNNLNYALAN